MLHSPEKWMFQLQSSLPQFIGIGVGRKEWWSGQEWSSILNLPEDEEQQCCQIIHQHCKMYRTLSVRPEAEVLMRWHEVFVMRGLLQIDASPVKKRKSKDTQRNMGTIYPFPLQNDIYGFCANNLMTFFLSKPLQSLAPPKKPK